ncbi:site-specific integrase, partial [Candidatus Uhrbacteria bacterium]|nr:site-specific integrase [Candidatus Uhrbacteria bacterium]
PHENRAMHLRWKEDRRLLIRTQDGWREMTGANRNVILRYIDDLEYGLNTLPTAKKGPRSYVHINNTRFRITRLATLFEEHASKTLAELEERDVIALTHGMRCGTITRRNGKRYRSTGNYAKVFKGFWHWYMRTERKHGRRIKDITKSIDTTNDDKPPFVYMTIDDVRSLCDAANPRMRTMMLFMFDAGLRSPTELANVKVKDIVQTTRGTIELSIRDETSKTFGRRIKLMLCGQRVLQWIAERHLTPEDFLFSFSPVVVNKYLKRLGARVFPDGNGGGRMSLGRKPFHRLTMYDFRHSACCYWLPRYKNESALKYRFGWKNTSMIHYYSELLGMKDTIAEEDLLDPDTTKGLERDLHQERQHTALMEEQFTALQHEIAELRAQTSVHHHTDDIMDTLTNNPIFMRAIADMMLDDEIASKLRALKSGARAGERSPCTDRSEAL